MKKAEVYNVVDVILKSQGRLFVTEDHFISDGIFMEGYGKSAENLGSLNELRQELGVFRGEFITMALRNPIDFWLCHEPITLIFDIQNRGNFLEETVLTIELPESMEPIGATEICIPSMSSLAKTSFALQVIPRLDREYPNMFTASCSDSNLRIKTVQNKLTVAPKYSTQLRTQSRRDSLNFERLKQIIDSSNANNWLKKKNIDNLEELAAIDTSACLNKIRSVAELLAHKITGVYNLGFAALIKKIQERNLLSQKSIGYLHTVRVLGNLASHPSGETITLDDVRIAAFALSCILEDMLNKELSL